MVSVSLGICGANIMSVHNENATQRTKQRGGASDSNDVRILSMLMAKEENCSCIILQSVKGPMNEHVRDAK